MDFIFVKNDKKVNFPEYFFYFYNSHNIKYNLNNKRKMLNAKIESLNVIFTMDLGPVLIEF